MIAVLSFAFCLAGVVMLCIAMPRHWKALRPGRPQPPLLAITLRVVGAAMLTLAAAVCISAYDVSIGLVVSFGVFTLAQLALSLALPYTVRPQGDQ